MKYIFKFRNEWWRVKAYYSKFQVVYNKATDNRTKERIIYELIFDPEAIEARYSEEIRHQVRLHNGWNSLK